MIGKRKGGGGGGARDILIYRLQKLILPCKVKLGCSLQVLSQRINQILVPPSNAHPYNKSKKINVLNMMHEDD